MLTENLAVITSDEARERLVPPAPVLISEHEVALATAIALRTAEPTRPIWAEASQAVLGALRRTFASSAQSGRPARRDYPRHYSYLENACMAREMARL